MQDRERGRKGEELPAPAMTGGGLSRTHTTAITIVLLVGFVSVAWQVLILSGGDALPISTTILKTINADERQGWSEGAMGRRERPNVLENTTEIRGPLRSVDLSRNGSLRPLSHVRARVEALAGNGNGNESGKDNGEEANCKPNGMDPWPFERQDAGGSAKWPNVRALYSTPRENSFPALTFFLSACRRAGSGWSYAMATSRRPSSFIFTRMSHFVWMMPTGTWRKQSCIAVDISAWAPPDLSLALKVEH
jgi:hypothetical protein